MQNQLCTLQMITLCRLASFILFFTGTFLRHLEKGDQDEEPKSSACHAQASTSTASNSSSSEDENELLEPEESMDHETVS